MTDSNTPDWNDPYSDGEYGPWDALTLGGFLFPGLCRITGSLGIRLDEQSTPGANGANSEDRGADPAKLTIQIRAWKIEQAREIEGYLETLYPRQRGDTESIPLDIVHPSVTSPAVGMRQVRIKEMTIPEITSDEWTVTLTAIEYFPSLERQRRSGRQNGKTDKGDKKGTPAEYARFVAWRTRDR